MPSSASSTRLILSSRSEEDPVTHGSARRVRAVSHEEQWREGAQRRAWAMRCATRRAGRRYGAWDGCVGARYAHQHASSSQQQLHGEPERLSARSLLLGMACDGSIAAKRVELGFSSRLHDPLEETRTSAARQQRQRGQRQLSSPPFCRSEDSFLSKSPILPLIRPR